ncbi:hypothetical protein [Pannonibacter phragmitetus]|uniref:hypothetical protein n=1 Tax=Pannonibacter phragmitetus TaxID=121719 RepID=UPI003D2F2A63
MALTPFWSCRLNPAVRRYSLKVGKVNALRRKHSDFQRRVKPIPPFFHFPPVEGSRHLPLMVCAQAIWHVRQKALAFQQS